VADIERQSTNAVSELQQKLEAAQAERDTRCHENEQLRLELATIQQRRKNENPPYLIYVWLADLPNRVYKKMKCIFN